MKQIAGVIAAGGGATRIGGGKALLPFAGGRLIDAVIARAISQVWPLALNVSRGSAGDYRCEYRDYPLVFDSDAETLGPLAGVIAGLEWLHGLGGAEWLATFPCDTPFLPDDLVAQLMAEAGGAPVFAHDGERLHGVCAVWPLSCLVPLRAGVKDGTLRSVHSAMQTLGGRTCQIEAGKHAFFNVNTPDDLIRAEELARGAQRLRFAPERE